MGHLGLGGGGDDPPANTAFGWAPVDDDNDGFTSDVETDTPVTTDTTVTTQSTTDTVTTDTTARPPRRRAERPAGPTTVRF